VTVLAFISYMVTLYVFMLYLMHFSDKRFFVIILLNAFIILTEIFINKLLLSPTSLNINSQALRDNIYIWLHIEVLG
jgi:heme/copper-type cytochrome/quinol oxidase subunit 4